MGTQGLLVSTLVVIFLGVVYIEACNEAVCASLVSKCMLLKSCECNMLNKDNCTCCKDCHKCLDRLYTECCSCVGMCPEKSSKSNLRKSSTVEELEEPIPALFNVLTEEEDELLRWTTYTYPAHLDLLYFQPRGHSLDLNLAASFTGEDGTSIRHGKHRINTQPHADTTNCTVAYMAQCMSLTKCHDSCQSMGAARYRWFHNYGCCECIGSTCLDFGKGEPLCLHCSSLDVEEEEEELDGLKGRGGKEGGLNGGGVLDKEIRVDTLGGKGHLGGNGHLPEAAPEEEVTLRPLTGGLSGGLSGGSLDSASLALGDQTAGGHSNKHRKSKSSHKHHGGN